MTGRTWAIFIAVVVVLFGGLLYLSSRDNIDVSNVDTSKVQSAQEKSGNIADHVYGSDAKKVILVEYGDYQCPGCGAAYDPIKTVTEKYKGQLTFVFRNYPLTTIHPNARAAASAAEAAGLMGKYWEMHDKLYESQSDWENASTSERTEQFVNYAGEIGLDKAKFRTTLNEKGQVINQKINFDLALGKKNGVDGTPTFYLNGKKLDQTVKDGKLVASGGSNVWADADQFDKLILQPAFKEAGIDVSSVQDDTKE